MKSNFVTQEPIAFFKDTPIFDCNRISSSCETYNKTQEFLNKPLTLKEKIYDWYKKLQSIFCIHQYTLIIFNTNGTKFKVCKKCNKHIIDGNSKKE